jgi:general secretion pathway protein G
VISLERFVSVKQHGASLFEFVVSITVAGVLMGFLLSRLWYYQGEAERAAVYITVNNIRSALEIKAMQSKLPGRSADLTFLTEENPFRLLKVTPPNYVGELYSPSLEDIGAGNWCFDRTNKAAVYLLNYGNSFEDSQTKLLRFKVKLQGLPQSPAKPSGAPESLGVAFEQVKD